MRQHIDLIRSSTTTIPTPIQAPIPISIPLTVPKINNKISFTRPKHAKEYEFLLNKKLYIVKQQQ